MNIYPGVKKYTKDIEANAKKVGLDKVDFTKNYVLSKTGAKKESSHGYPNEMEAARGQVQVIGNEDYVWILVSDHSYWFKTSPILSVRKVKDKYKIETENSFYELKVL